MELGNTVILALSASHQPFSHPYIWLQALLAIAFFFLRSFFTERLGHILSPLRHGTLTLSFLIQSILIMTAAGLIQREVVPGLHPTGTEKFIQLVPLPMLSFQAGQQSIATRQLGFNKIPTTVLTSVYYNLENDPKLFTPLQSNWRQNQRFLATVLLILSAIIRD